MGYIRGSQPAALNRAAIAASVTRFIGEAEIAGIMGAADPFGIDDPCTRSPSGQHQAIASCGAVVCCHCAKVF